MKSIYKTTRLRRTSSLRFFAHSLLLLQCRWALLSSFRVGIDSGLFVVNLIKLENVDVLFCCITHRTNHIVYLEIQCNIYNIM